MVKGVCHEVDDLCLIPRYHVLKEKITLVHGSLLQAIHGTIMCTCAHAHNMMIVLKSKINQIITSPSTK